MSRVIARIWMFLWRFKLVPPSEPLPDKCVVIAAPHTTNWDFPMTLAIAWSCGVDMKWLGKDALFKGLAGPVMRGLGGVSIDRSAPQGMVSLLAAEFEKRDRFVLVVPAEGTRSATSYWKSGFYRIAEAARVPIVCAYVDKATRTGGFGPVIPTTGNLVADMDKVRAFYGDKVGFRSGRTGPIRLRDEEAADASGGEVSIPDPEPATNEPA